MVVVRCHGSQERVGQDQDLSSHGDQGDFGGFAACFESGVEGFHGRAVTDRGHGGLVERDAYFAATTADVADAAGGAAVVGKGSQAHESGDGLSGTLSEFGQVDQESPRDLGTDADDGLEDVVFGFEGGRLGDDTVQAVFEVLDLLFEKGDDLGDIA